MDPASRIVALCEAMACSSAWARLRGDARLAVRPDAGIIGILGTVASGDRPILDAVGGHVAGLLEHLLPVPYAEAERACFDLAEIIRARLEPDDLADARIVPIPRGGLIVAAMLAYALGLPPDQVGSTAATGGVTILVDDCAISGTRLRERLAVDPRSQSIVALLYAHPDLCRRVEASSAAVIACVAARDLVDHAIDRPDYEAWWRRWAERSPQDLWTGDPDHVVFPWNEPDALVWNEVSGVAEAGWRVVPPSWCLKNRVAADPSDVQRCEPQPGPVTPADTTVWADVNGMTLVAGLGDPRALALKGSAAAMWRGIARTGSVDETADAVGRQYDMTSETVRNDLAAFIARLTQRGLLVAR